MLISALLFYLSICGVFYIKQARLIYAPSRVTASTPGDVGMTFDDLDLRADDGVRLSAWAMENGSGPWILYCHGNGGNMHGRLFTARALHEMGASVLMFDYRGYGRSDGEPSEEGLYRDTEAAWRWLTETRKVSPLDVVIWGESLGGGVATWLAERHEARALVLQSTFTSLPDVGASVYWWLPVQALCRHIYPSLERMKRITCPVLHMHAPDDDLIPYAVGRRLYEAGREPHQWIDTSGGHNASPEIQSPQTRAEIARFVLARTGAAAR